jgi:hypothetical protein
MNPETSMGLGFPQQTDFWGQKAMLAPLMPIFFNYFKKDPEFFAPFCPTKRCSDFFKNKLKRH